MRIIGSTLRNAATARAASWRRLRASSATNRVKRRAGSSEDANEWRTARRDERSASRLPTTFVPGRNLVFLAFAGALAYRRGVKHLVAGMCETDFSGYPDCRDDTIKCMQLALNLGMERRFVIHTPLMWIDKAA